VSGFFNLAINDSIASCLASIPGNISQETLPSSSKDGFHGNTPVASAQRCAPSRRMAAQRLEKLNCSVDKVYSRQWSRLRFAQSLHNNSTYQITQLLRSLWRSRPLLLWIIVSHHGATGLITSGWLILNTVIVGTEHYTCLIFASLKKRKDDFSSGSAIIWHSVQWRVPRQQLSFQKSVEQHRFALKAPAKTISNVSEIAFQKRTAVSIASRHCTWLIT